MKDDTFEVYTRDVCDRCNDKRTVIRTTPGGDILCAACLTAALEELRKAGAP